MSVRRKKILLVEDDAIVRRAIALILPQYELIQAEDMPEAQELFLQNPDVMLVVSDYLLSDGDGLELREWLRSRSTVPFLMISGSYWRNGNEDFVFLAKPFSADQLRNAIQELLEGSSRVLSDLP